MLQRIFYTFAARLGGALLNFAVVWLTARFLGAAGRGQVSLFVTDLTFILMFIGLLGGSSLIYLAPRRSIWHLALPAVGWATLVCAAGAAVIGFGRGTTFSYAGHLFGVGWLQAAFSIVITLLLARRREHSFNLLNIAQAGLLAVALATVFLGLRLRLVSVYWWACYLAYGLPLLAGLLLLRRLPDAWRRPPGELRAVVRELAQHSRGAHFSNILAFLNYRLSYYFVAHFADARAVGVLSVGVALAEAIWMIPRSAALVQYVDLVNAADKHAQLASTLRASRLAALASAGAVAGLALVPAGLLRGFFGPEFGEAQVVIAWLAPGVVAIALNVACSSYFAGLARYRVNNVAALLGLAVTVPACWLLIPRLDIVGAALATSLSYWASTAYLLWQFSRATGAGWAAWLPGPADAAYLRQMWRRRRQPLPR